MTIKAPSAAEFCSIIGSQKVSDAWSGSAFRDHPKGIFRENMIFTNEWNVHNYCSVQVATSKAAKLVLGCQDPAAHGNPDPTVSEGDLVTVYSNGRWVAEGPWCKRIVAILEDVKREIAEIADRERAENEARQEAAKRVAAEKLDAARAVFSTSA